MLEAIFQSAGVLPLLNDNAAPILGILAGILSIFAFAPYVRDTLARRTRPQRATWFIWSVLCCITLATQIHEGATGSMWFVVIQTSATVFIFALSITRGTGSFVNVADTCMLGAAGFGLVLWGLTDTSGYALAIIIAISSLGGIATVKKSYADPASETMSTWVMSLAAAAMAILAIDEPSWVLMAYPVYLFVLYGSIVISTRMGRARKPQLGMAPIFWSDRVEI